ncbi:MAG: MATE family efflux transporter [Tannerellaceae bacterium]|nr:MATE family efflux transporter [Tannerellaceae bacterium]
MLNNKQIWKISYPILLSLLAQNAINITDTAFLGRAGEIELGASALGGLLYICAYTIAFGFSVGSQILMARRNGEKNYTKIGSIMMQGTIFLLALAITLAITLHFASAPLLDALLTSADIRQATLAFLNIRIFGFLFSFINGLFRAFFVAITRTKALTINAILMATINIILDYCLIFGNAGFPAMGLEGAALASVIAEASSIIFYILYMRATIDTNRYGLNRLNTPNPRLLRQILSVSIFTMLQQFGSMATFFFFFIVVEHIGQRQLAIANIVRSIYIALFIPVNALSTTTNTLVSNAIGAGRPTLVIPIIKRTAQLSLLVMLATTLILTLIPSAPLTLYSNDPTLIAQAIPSVRVIAIAMLFCAAGAVAFNGLSGTGNTRPALYIELITLLFYCIYIYIIGMHLQLPVHICFTSEILYFSLLLLLSTLYLRHGHWRGKTI